MFTGIVEGMGTVEAVEPRGAGVRFGIRLGALAEGIEVGHSVAISGCCLTVVERASDLASFDAIPETIEKTHFETLSAGDRVNLERALRLGGRLDGHLVQGHVDGVATCTERVPVGGPWGEVRFAFEAEPALVEPMVMKGSVAIDGVSLTLTEVCETRFAVAIIPHTLEVTTFGHLQPGDRINLENDVVGKWFLKSVGPYLERLKQLTGARDTP